MKHSGPLYSEGTGTVLDTVALDSTSGGVAAVRNDDRYSRHQGGDQKNARRGRRAKPDEEENLREIVDVVTLSENAQKWVSQQGASSGDDAVASQPDTGDISYASQPRTLPAVVSEQHTPERRMLTRYDLMCIAAQQAMNKQARVDFMEGVLPPNDPGRADFDKIIGTLQDRFPPADIVQNLRLQILAHSLLRLKRIVRKQYSMVDDDWSGRNGNEVLPQDMKALYGVEKAIAEDVYQSMNEISSQNRHSAWDQGAWPFRR